MTENTAAAPVVTFKRYTPNHTHVYLDGVRIGRITRKSGSNSSPRGGAYRDFYYAAGCASTFYSRKEAAEFIVRRHAERTAAQTTTNTTEN